MNPLRAGRNFAMFIADHGYVGRHAYSGRIDLVSTNIGRSALYVFLRCARPFAEPRVKDLLRFRRMPNGNGMFALSREDLVWRADNKGFAYADPQPEYKLTPDKLTTKTMSPGQRHPSTRSERLIGKARLKALANPEICSHAIKEENEDSAGCHCADCGKPIYRRKRY